ncbi:MAG: hypothetical protein QW555_07890 [Nitrososphaerota archaeon]
MVEKVVYYKRPGIYVGRWDPPVGNIFEVAKKDDAIEIYMVEPEVIEWRRGYPWKGVLRYDEDIAIHVYPGRPISKWNVRALERAVTDAKIVRGDTYEIRELLKKWGFRWSPEKDWRRG